MAPTQVLVFGLLLAAAVVAAAEQGAEQNCGVGSGCMGLSLWGGNGRPRFPAWRLDGAGEAAGRRPLARVGGSILARPLHCPVGKWPGLGDRRNGVATPGGGGVLASECATKSGGGICGFGVAETSSGQDWSL